MSEGNETKSYDLPLTEDFSGMTPAAAQSEIDKVLSAASADPKHPYSDAHGYKHRQHVERVSKLYEVACRGKPSVFEKVLAEAQAEQGKKQNKLIAEAEKEMDALEKLGFSRDEIPDDLKEYQLNALRMQRLHTEGKYDELTPVMSKELRTLKVPADILSLFESFNRASGLDEQLKRDISEKVIFWIHAANKAKFRPPKAKAED